MAHDGNLLAEAIVRITLDKAELDRGSRDVKAKLALMRMEAKGLTKISQAYVGLSKSINRMFLIPVAGIAAAGLAKFFKSGVKGSEELRKSWSNITSSVDKFLVRMGQTVNKGNRVGKIFDGIARTLDSISPKMMESILSIAKWALVVSMVSRVYGWLNLSVARLEKMLVVMGKLGALQVGSSGAAGAAGGAGAGSAGAAGAGAIGLGRLASVGKLLGKVSLWFLAIDVALKALGKTFGFNLHFADILSGALKVLGTVFAAVGMATNTLANVVVLVGRVIGTTMSFIYDAIKRLVMAIPKLLASLNPANMAKTIAGGTVAATKSLFKGDLAGAGSDLKKMVGAGPLGILNDAFAGFGLDLEDQFADISDEFGSSMANDWRAMVESMKEEWSRTEPGPGSLSSGATGKTFAFSELVGRFQESVLGAGTERAVKDMSRAVTGRLDTLIQTTGKTKQASVYGN